MSVGAEIYDLRAIDTMYQDSLGVEFLDYIPIVSTVSGIARFVFGGVEATVGAFVLPIQIAGRLVNYRQPYIFVLGVANMVRGAVAAKPIVGNIILYLYDHSLVVKRDLRRSVGIDIY